MSDTGMQAMIAATEDHMIDAIQFGKFRPTASYVVERKSVRIPFLAPIYSPKGVTVMRATIADPGWLDCSCCHLSVLVKNTSRTEDSHLVPLTKFINGAFSRGRLISGMVLEDVLEYQRVSHIYDVMRPKQGSDMDRIMGVPEQYNNHTQTHEVIPIRDGESKRVWHKPCFGVMYQDKWIPSNLSLIHI